MHQTGWGEKGCRFRSHRFLMKGCACEELLRNGDGEVLMEELGTITVEGRGWVWFFFLASSTGFVVRGRPLSMCSSRNFWSGATDLAHRHFFPSVLRHRPGSEPTAPNKLNKFKQKPMMMIHYQKKRQVEEKTTQHWKIKGFLLLGKRRSGGAGMEAINQSFVSLKFFPLSNCKRKLQRCCLHSFLAWGFEAGDVRNFRV